MLTFCFFFSVFILINFHEELDFSILSTILWDLVKISPNDENKENKTNHGECFEEILSVLLKIKPNFNLNKHDYYNNPLLYYSLNNKQDSMSLQLLKYGASLIHKTNNESVVLEIDPNLLLNHLNNCIQKSNDVKLKPEKPTRMIRKKGEYHIDITSLLPANYKEELDYKEDKTEDEIAKDEHNILTNPEDECSHNVVNDKKHLIEPKNENKKNEIEDGNNIELGEIATLDIEDETAQVKHDDYQYQCHIDSVSEMPVLEAISSDKEYDKLLLHPVIDIFLMLKWYKIRYLFYFELFMYLFYTILLFVYLLISIDYKLSYVKFWLFFIVVLYAILILIWEVIQMVLFRLEYFKYFENYLNLILILCSFIIFVFDAFSIRHTRNLYAFTSIVLFVNLFYMTINIPCLSINVIMVRTVYKSLLKFLLNYILLIAAFTSGFHILFYEKPEKAWKNEDVNTNSPDFKNFGYAFFKTFIMLTGEYDTNSLQLGKYPIQSRIIVGIFAIFLSIGILNLLIGLAVFDIQNIRSKSLIYDKKLRLEQVLHLEKVWLNNKLVRKIPSLLKIVKKIFILSYIRENTYSCKTEIIINRVKKTVRVKNSPYKISNDTEKDQREIKFIIDNEFIRNIENVDKFSLEKI